MSAKPYRLYSINALMVTCLGFAAAWTANASAEKSIGITAWISVAVIATASCIATSKTVQQIEQ